MSRRIKILTLLSVIASEAKQSYLRDCFVAMLLAMTGKGDEVKLFSYQIDVDLFFRV